MSGAADVCIIRRSVSLNHRAGFKCAAVICLSRVPRKANQRECRITVGRTLPVGVHLSK